MCHHADMYEIKQKFHITNFTASVIQEKEESFDLNLVEPCQQPQTQDLEK